MEKKKFKATFEFEIINSKEITLSSEHNFKVLPSNVDKIGQILAADLINFLTGEKVPENIFQAKNVIVSETYTEDNKHKFDAIVANAKNVNIYLIVYKNIKNKLGE